MLDLIASRFKKLSPAVDFWSLRIVEGQSQALSVRQDILEPVENSGSLGAMLTIIDKGGAGYAATSDLTIAGLKQAVAQARKFAAMSVNRGVFSVDNLVRPGVSGRYQTLSGSSWSSTSMQDKIQLLTEACAALKISDAIVYWLAYLRYSSSKTLLTTCDGIRIEQSFDYIRPGLIAVANKGSKSQTRTGGGAGSARQGGLEQLQPLGFPAHASRISEEALALLAAPECPSGRMQILLTPDQMMLQIHESIGHPLELDRILGDERNYAGTSFVTQEMFGSYQYGSELLNITFDPTVGNEIASYAFDDDGTEAKREFIIDKGILKTPLGGATSQARAHCSGVANARADSWKRPAIDRMANLNLEPGNASFAELVQSVENGVLMKTNASWSIDDSRNKFQFGCEYGQRIKDGELKGLLRNPNYRGISANFWRNLAKVGNRSTFDVLGTPNCGKGEPNQVIQVGHASPSCVFENVEVFGGEGES